MAAAPLATSSFLATRRGKLDARVPVRGRVPRLRRRVDRQRRATVDPPRPALLGAEPAVGAQRLPAHLRRLHAARRPGRRPARPPADAGRRDHRCSGSPRSRPGSPAAKGMLIGARLAQGVGAAMMSPAALSILTTTLQRGHRPQQGARRLGRDRRARLRGRRVPRRRDLGGTGLAVGVLRQPARLRAGPRRRVPA